MGAVLDDDSGIAELSGRDYWEAELKNKKILLRRVEEIIFNFTSSTGANGIQSYTIDTGQSKQTVTRENLGSLYNMQKALTEDIAALEFQLHNGAPKRIAPRY